MSQETKSATDSTAVPGNGKSSEVENVKRRLLSLDVYRGIVLLLLCTEAPNGDRWRAITDARPASEFWNALAYQGSHVSWVGCAIWDMIQPSFMFMVGVSMAYSYAKRKRLGQSQVRMFGHVVVRSLVLILLGVFLRSVDRSQTYWTFEDVLTQIGLGYVFLYLLWNRGWKIQLGAIGAILLGYWLLFAATPVYEVVGNPRDILLFEGFLANWNVNANPAHFFDVWFLNLFPRSEPFAFHPSGYNTLNFIPSLAIMVMGLMAGEFLKSETLDKRKFLRLLLIGIGCVVVGWLTHAAGICPLVKKTWTPTFTLFSGGICLIVLSLLYGVIDVIGLRKWTLPLVVLGMNSIALYMMIHLFPSFFVDTFQTHFGKGYASLAGAEFTPMLQNLSSVAVLWAICFWMYRRRIFLRI